MPAEAQSAEPEAPVFTALPVLEIPAVPALGGASVARPTSDPRAALQNPAILGLTAGSVRQATAATPSETWFGEQNVGLGAASLGASVGVFDVGAAVSQGTLSGDPRTLADGSTYDPTDRYRALSVGAATHGPVRLALGATARYVTTTDAPLWTGAEYSVGQLRGVTLDVGALATADVAHIANASTVAGLHPALDVTVGYAQSHLGGTVRYAGYQRQSLPRTATLGWSAVAGLDRSMGQHRLRVIEAEVAAQADHSLVRQDETGTHYDLVAGGLSPADALLGTSDARTTGRRGVRVALAETLALSTGRFDGWGYDDARTRSVEVSTAGLFKTLASRADRGPLADLGALDLRLGRTTVWAGTPQQTTRTTLSLMIGR